MKLGRKGKKFRKGKTPLQRLFLATIALILVISGGMFWGKGTSAAGLTKVGPIHEDNGYPVWYKDSNGIRLQQCLDLNDPYCALDPAEIPDPTKPLSVKDNNFPHETFYMLAGSGLDLPNGGRAIGAFQLEAAWAQEEVIPGDQIVFGRVRIRVDGLTIGQKYTVTHPYGTDVFTAVDDRKGNGEINYTQDIGINGGFEGALKSRIGPFLQWDPAVAPAAPAGYVGDPNLDHQVIGSTLIDPTGKPQNYFKIEGPGIAQGPNGTLSPNACGGTNPNCIETNLFSLMGKKATNLGVDIDRATYSRTSDAGGFIDVFASSADTDVAIDVSGTGIKTTRMQGGGDGEYFARVAYTGSEPPEVTVTNTTDVPITVKKLTPVDLITVTKAEYNTDSKTLTVEATSSDALAVPALDIKEFVETSVDGKLIVENLGYIPPNITVTSSKNGTVTVPVTVTGGASGQVPIIVSPGPEQNVNGGDLVTLLGDSSGDPNALYAWSQVSGTPVTLTAVDLKTVTFTAPNTTETLEFLLTVTSSDGRIVTGTVKVNVSAEVPIANAGPDQATVVQGSLVTLDGSASTGASSYSWKQTAGPTAQLNLTNPANPTFTFPKQPDPITFELTTTGVGGATSTDTVTISTVPDQPTITRAEYRRDNRSWRVDGTTNVFGPDVTITVHLGSTITGPVIGTTQASNTGAWSFTGTSPAGTTTPRTISIKSSSGGKVENFTVRVR